MTELPKSLMSKVAWAFTKGPYPTPEAFAQAFRGYNERIFGEDRPLNDGVALSVATVRIQYHCWRGDDDVEPVVTLISDDPAGFTEMELLYKSHNATIEDLREMDHHFFEGLSLGKAGDEENPPLYRLRLGS